MSDFSAGFFTLSENKEKVYPFLTDDEIFIQYNESWVGKLSEMDMGTDYLPQTLALSKEVPLLHIIHAEDHGFVIRILHEGDVKFHFDASYEVGADLYTEIGNELYGCEWWADADISKIDERHQKIKVEWAKQLEEQGLLNAFFANINEDSLKAFQIFGITDEALQNINQILTVKNFSQDSHKMVYDLLDCLGLVGFSFVSHQYASYGDDDRFTVLNP